MFILINNLKNKKGFTLIELIVVLAVLAIIMAIAVPRFIGVQKDAEAKADLATLEMIEKAAELYFAQNPSINNVSVSALNLDYKWNGTTTSATGATINRNTGDVTLTR